MDQMNRLFGDLQQQTMTRRRFIQGAALAAASVALPETTEAAGPLKATWVNHYTYVAPDMKKTRDWYHEVFGMQIGHQDAKTTHMWYGDKGYNTLMIIRQANAGELAPALVKFAFTIEPWDKKAVEEELKKRGLKPQSDDKGFWFKDPEGTEIGVFAKDAIKRPSAPAEKPMLWKAVSANHIVTLTPDYKKLGKWYEDLLNLKTTSDAGSDVYQWFGDTVWIPTKLRPNGKSSAELGSLDHVALTIDPFEPKSVLAELKKRGLVEPNTTESLGPNCKDLNGLHNQVCDRKLVPDSESKRKT